MACSPIRIKCSPSGCLPIRVPWKSQPDSWVQTPGICCQAWKPPSREPKLGPLGPLEAARKRLGRVRHASFQGKLCPGMLLLRVTSFPGKSGCLEDKSRTEFSIMQLQPSSAAAPRAPSLHPERNPARGLTSPTSSLPASTHPQPQSSQPCHRAKGRKTPRGEFLNKSQSLLTALAVLAGERFCLVIACTCGLRCVQFAHWQCGPLSRYM